MTSIELGVRINALLAGRRTLFNDRIKYGLDLDLDEQRISQGPAFRAFQRSVLRALREVFTRHPERGWPSVYMQAWLGDESQSIGSLSLVIKHSGRKRLFFHGDQPSFCRTNGEALRKLRAAFLAETDRWFGLFLEDQGALRRYSFLLGQKRLELAKAAAPAALPRLRAVGLN